MSTTNTKCDHTRLKAEGGTMYRVTDKRGKETRVCDCCHWQPGQPEKRDRDDYADVLTAAALGPVTPSINPATTPLSDVLADLDATPPARRDPTAALAAIAATQQAYEPGESVVFDVGYGYPRPRGQWVSIRQAVDACLPYVEALRGFDCWLIVRGPDGKAVQQISLDDMLAIQA